ncbi:unnamed protein product [Phaedon cochleariae]|uniref:Hamartin n=1 Tax=Phaedon cochleariae TaxID=80249 RepID=A0A9P0GTU7_PHACE|nr:unnamed protein product [Phaedon cochleariae]
MTDIFERLESNDKETVEDAKQTIREQFTKVNEPWLLHGLYEYYLTTSSDRAMEILVNIKEPHHVYLFDRLSDSMKLPKVETKVQALTLFGYVARRQPTWLYKLQEHNLLKDLLKLLKNEVELLPLISALLVLIVLLPMIPSAMGSYLKEIFEIFSRLASWNCNPVEDQLIHLQVALYALFLRLYGMYPCNFLGYLRNQYREKNTPVFVHTIKPMLDTVRMHPSLVTASEDNETTTERWKKMGVHDVIVECERFSLDLTDRCPHDSCQYTSGFRSRSGTSNSTMESHHRQNLKNIASLQMPNTEPTNFFSPSRMFTVPTPPISESLPTNILQAQGISSNFPSQEGTSPPEAAIEATPETTPVRGYRAIPARSQPLNSNIVRALTTFNTKPRPSGSLSSTPTHSQPSSPMRKDFSSSAFSYSSEHKAGYGFGGAKPETRTNQKINKLILDRAQIVDVSSSTESSRYKNLPQPSSPLRIISSETVSRQFNSSQRNESPASQEDEEVLSIVSRNDLAKPLDSDPPSQECDSCSDDKLGEEQEHGSPCTAGGLHMPNSKSINNFAKRVQRLRHHSQCDPKPEKIETSTGSSPGNGIPFPNSTTVRRAVSCPEMKKSVVIQPKDNIERPLNESDEEVSPEKVDESVNKVNGFAISEENPKKSVSSSTTQTENFWPYEHLFLGVFPSLENSEIKASPEASPAPFNIPEEKIFPATIYDTLDKYIESAVHSADWKNSQHLKDQLQLVHQQLLFERHRRETHAYRNRRLLSDAKSTRSLEEHNSALRDTVQLQQRDLEDLRDQLEYYKRERMQEDKKLNKTIQYWENQCKEIQEELKSMKETNENMLKDLNDAKSRCAMSDSKLLEAQAELLNAIAEVNIARQQASAGEKGRKELEQVNKELLLIGELHLKYQEKLDSVYANKRSDKELEELKSTYEEELKGLNQQLEAKLGNLEAYRNRVVELEHTLISKEDLILTQKQSLALINEQRFVKLEAVESKYQTQLTINRGLEEKLLDLWQRLEAERGKRPAHSPDTSSCHEVNVTTTAGLSPHSSPLSASLASSEGSSAFHEREVKNLQAIVDQKETTRVEFDDPGRSYTEGEGRHNSTT